MSHKINIELTSDTMVISEEGNKDSVCFYAMKDGVLAIGIGDSPSDVVAGRAAKQFFVPSSVTKEIASFLAGQTTVKKNQVVLRTSGTRDVARCNTGPACSYSRRNIKID